MMTIASNKAKVVISRAEREDETTDNASTAIALGEECKSVKRKEKMR